MPRDDAALLDIDRTAGLVLDFTREMKQNTLLDDSKTQSAVLRQIMIIGEAVKRLSPTFRARRKNIPWLLIAGMRDRPIHAYDAVDLDEVWRTVEKDIPGLLAMLEPLLPSKQ